MTDTNGPAIAPKSAAQNRPAQNTAGDPPRQRSALKRFLPTGLYGRSLIIIVTPMVLLQAIVAYIFLERHWQTVTERLSEATVSEISFLLDARKTLSEPDIDRKLTQLAATEFDMSVAFIPGETIDQAEDSMSIGLLHRSLSEQIVKQIGLPYRIDTESLSDHVDIRIAYEGGVLRALPLRSHVYAANSHIFIVWMVAASLVLITVAILFLRNQIKPIERLALAAESFGMGRDVPEFRATGASEVRRAAAAFLAMRERIQRQIEQRTAMLAGVSHDLRTPLTRFKLQIAMLGDGPEIEELKADVREMEKMLEEYLDFVRGDQGETTSPVDLSDLMAEIRQERERNGTTIDLQSSGYLVAPIRRNAMKRCIANLVDNACRHGEKVVVTMARSNDGITIFIDDNGEGIPDEKLEEVFRPFLRLDEGRNLDAGGTGLGLSIARDIARAHGGDIQLSRSPLGGLRATLQIPV